MSAKQINPNLTEAQKSVLLGKATEAPFTGKFLHNKDGGTYNCANCGQELFRSDTKFDSGTGWPSFYDIAKSGNHQASVKLLVDNSGGMIRTEAVCTKCGAHLGHVFDDGPQDKTGKRYCINSVCLDLNPKK